MASGELLLQMASTEEMLKILECPVCLELPFPPIYQCINGHIICKHCRPKLNICGVCMQTFSDVRNLTAEQIVTASLYTCKYEKNGCPAALNGSAMEAHLKTCQFRNVGNTQHGRTQIRTADQVLKELTSLADELKPEANEVESSFAKYVIQKLFVELQTNCKGLQKQRLDDGEIDAEEFNEQKYSLDRIKIVGSVGKNTNIRTFSDFDCVVFVNNRDKPGGGFKGVLDDFQQTLTMMVGEPQFQFHIYEVDRKERSISVDVRVSDDDEEENAVDGYDLKINLFPAHNLLWKVNKSGINVELTQGLYVLTKIGAFDKPGKKLAVARVFYRSALAEMQVRFVKSQSEFVLQIVRIAKFWNLTLELGEVDGEFSVRSTLIETVAIFAGREVEASAQGNPANKLFRAFKKFLTLLVKFNDLNIVMMDTLSEINVTVPDFILEQAQVGPLVVDPGNPYTNLASTRNINELDVGLLKEFAAESKARLLKYRTEVDFELVDVFVPQPSGAWTDGKLRDLADIVLALT